ncbi:DUF6985 domain-containing protein [Kitasatospora sp. NPDC057198]|uniref:DUF6985 domain-containing protein n=1 Tax=Kitasatospora sp. NPDC057198 TaxID=3346046 RepID=UPI00362BCEFC
MEIPGLGPVTADADSGEHVSPPLPVPVLGGARCRFVVLGYGDDHAEADFETAVRTFLELDESALRAASAPVFQYYLDVRAALGDDAVPVTVTDPDDVWSHVRPGDEVTVQREDAHGDRQVYVSVECECAWEPEHGLQLVFRRGESVTKAGSFDGHLTNAAAFDRPDLADTVYHRSG